MLNISRLSAAVSTAVAAAAKRSMLDAEMLRSPINWQAHELACLQALRIIGPYFAA